ncbi:MAG TPA: carboxypeptidase regulatory-like domain-containing protein [Thermoanaerobaculia bacterium]
MRLFVFAIAFLAATVQAQVTVTGTVVDPSNAAVAGATVNLGAQNTLTDSLGRFRIEGVPTGRNTIDVKAASFTPLRQRVDVTPSMQPLVLHLALAALQESVEVNAADDVRPVLDPSANLDTTTLSGESLEQLPVFDQDIIGALTPFLDPAAVATGGTTIIVDGVEMKSAGVPKSAIDQIVVNDDPYSAESNRPGRGRIEITTKPGSGDVRGSINFTFRNSALAARNYFSPVKPPERRLAGEGMLTGPIGRDANSSFMLTFSQQDDDAVSVVHALMPSGVVDENVAAPSARTELMARVTHDYSEKHRASLQVNWKRFTIDEQGVGGVVLPQAGVNAVEQEKDLFFSLRSLLTPERMNQFQLTLEFDHEPTTSRSSAPGLIVRDAFVSGGAQATILRTESGGKLNDVFTISHGKHIFKAGVQIPNLNRRVWTDQTNQGGTFSFSSLADYEAGRPYAYVVQQGPGRVSLWWREYGAFVQDQVKLAKNVQALLGLRYDWQSRFHDTNNFSPRGSISWSPKTDGKTIVRAGGGVFYDRSGVAAVANLLLHDGSHLRSYTILNPSYPDPFANGVTLADIPTNITQVAPDVQIPYTVQFSTGVERQLTKGASLVVGYRGSRGHHMFRSVNVNAPLPPDYNTVPDPRYGIVQQIRSDGHMHSDALELTLRGKAGQHVGGQLQYTFSRTVNNTGGIFWFPADQYAAPGAEWGPSDFDQRHRLNALATFKSGRWIKLGVAVKYATALPYSLTAGEDVFHTGLSNARPAGVGRNTLRASDSRSVDLRWSHETPVSKGKTLTTSVDAFNIFNHPNFTNYVGNIRSPLFGSPTTVSAARRIQLSAEVNF